MNRSDWKKLLKEWKLLLENNNNNKDFLYYGSPKKFLKFNPSIPGLKDISLGKPVVFATNKKEIALCEIANWNEEDFEQGTMGNDNPFLIENYPKAFEKVYKGKSGYLYYLENKDFYSSKNLTNYEMISDKSPKIIKTVRIKDPLNALFNSSIQMIRYEDSKDFRKNDYRLNLDSVFVQVAVPPEAEESVMEKGLLNAHQIVNDPKLLSMARPLEKDREELVRLVKENPEANSFKGISVFFGEPDWNKITKNHFIMKWNLVMYKVNLSEFLKDYPDSWINGVELSPYIEKYYSLDEEEYSEKLEELGYNLDFEWPKIKKRKLSLLDVKKYSSMSPEDLWKWYDVKKYTGKKYAANVPHAQIMSSIDRIPPKYISKL